MSLKGKLALVTGSSRGIGRGIALKLAADGANVAIHYFQNKSAAENTLAKVRDLGSDGFIIQADVSRSEDVSRIFSSVKDRFGKLDVFVGNARPELSTFYTAPIEITLEQWDMAMDSQAKSFLQSIQESIRLMSDGGRIIAITYAPSARTGSWQNWVAMGSAKAAMESLCRYFAVTLAKRGITVNALSPGLTEDSVLNGLPEEVQNLARTWHESGWTPGGRLTTPADVGDAVLLLCSVAAGWITGQVIAVDGGASLMDTVFPLPIQQG